MNDERTPDGLLLRRYREGDEAAFAELRARHARLVLATCRRETGDAALAEDAAQGVFLLLTRKRFDDRASLAGWLHEASRLVSRNLVRAEGRRQTRERRAFEEFQAPEAGWNAASPHIDAALGSLKPGDREAVLLRFSGDMSLAEVGRALGIEENAARMRVSRSLERMREGLRRAGVGVSVLLLATLLSTRLADADAEGSILRGSPSPRARRASRLPLAKSIPWKPVLAAFVVAGGGIFARRAFGPPPRIDSLEAKLLFSRSVGKWHGTLEYADDATGARTKTATDVEVDRLNGGLRFVARYPGFGVADTTTISPLGARGFRIDNAGSHRLDGEYELVRLRDGTAALVGFSPAVRGEVQLRIEATERTLVIQETVRRAEKERLRNRFDLRRRP